MAKLLDENSLSAVKYYVDTALALKQNTLTFDITPTAGSLNPVTSDGIRTAIDNAVSGIYKPQGTKTVAQLNALTVTSSMNGYVYNVSDSGTLTHGSVSVHAGDNVAIIYDSGNNTWSWDIIGGVVDLSNYATLTGTNVYTGTNTFNNANGITVRGVTIKDYQGLQTGLDIYTSSGEWAFYNGSILPITGTNKDLGSTTYYWRKLYLNSGVQIDSPSNNSYSEIAPGLYSLDFKFGETSATLYTLFKLYAQVRTGDTTLYHAIFDTDYIRPDTNNFTTLGTSDKQWKAIYLAGAIKDGDGASAHSVTVAQMQHAVDMTSSGNILTYAEALAILQGS